MFDQDEFGSLIRAGRAMKHLNQQEAGDLIGMSRIAIFNYENGKALPKVDDFSRLCEVLEIDPIRALGLDKSKQ